MIWKPIENFENLYEVNEDGQVRGLKRGKLLKPQINRKTGYLHVLLWKNSKIQLHDLHRLVAQAFIENPHNYKFVSHIDGDLTNNAAENLQWMEKTTPYQNQARQK